MGELRCYNQGPVTREMAWNCLYLILCGLGEQRHHSEPLFTMERTQTSFSSCRYKKRGRQCSHCSVQCLAGLEAASFPGRALGAAWSPCRHPLHPHHHTVRAPFLSHTEEAPRGHMAQEVQNRPARRSL